MNNCSSFCHSLVRFSSIFALTLSLLVSNEVLSEELSPSFDCQPSKEYITVYNYLRKESPLALSSEARQQTAWRVAGGCHRSASRFIQVMKTLLKADMEPRHALETAVELSDGDDERVKAFLTIFKLAHGSNFLDMDLLQSLSMARALSVDFESMPNWLEKDFRDLVLFCISKTELNLPRPTCGRWATRLVLSSADKNLSLGVAEPFMTGFRFLTEKKGPQLTTGDALALLERLLEISPYAIDSMIEAYKFASSAKGLALDRSQAVKFAEKLSEKTVYQPRKSQAIRIAN